MDAIKSAVGLGKTTQEGQEPVSGQQGEGTAAQPFDQGNEDTAELGGKATQHTDSDQVTSGTSASSNPADSATTSGKSDPDQLPPVVGPAPAIESETSKASSSGDGGSEKPAIGSAGWFKTAIPLGKRNNQGSGQQRATAGVEQQTRASVNNQASMGAVQDTGNTRRETVETDSNLPPNHLGENVPEGAGVIRADTDKHEKTIPGPPAETSAAASGSQLESREGAAPAQEPSAAVPAPASSTSTTQPDDSAKQPDKVNPSAIPVAGGVKLGQAAAEDRESAPSTSPSYQTSAESNTQASASTNAAGAAEIPSNEPASSSASPDEKDGKMSKREKLKEKLLPHRHH